MNALKSLSVAVAAAAMIAPLALGGCASGSSGSGYKSSGTKVTSASRARTGARARHYYGHSWSPWIGFRRPVVVVPPGGGGGIDRGDREVDPDWGVEAPRMPEAVTLPSTPDMGMPDFGGDMGMGMDLGGFDF
ncbi:hypothetical protein SAMN04487965_2552 [Microbulbifer donghaiensis]|uniref:Lipoprotein n=1 Tax=Microbulbifer donghaiensis TaxID=494016 RepID=A0A1M5E0M8_9GAMM|nr:hypothetical protein [Microbulbifer donghaiensis]SHF72674.1 hypothetical protein SAMN04487965_2552 [Microbulbifer donghaiensis]